MTKGATDRDRLAQQRVTELDVREAALAARESSLAAREATLAVREKALADRMGAADEILAAAEERDAISDSRDIGSDTREQYLEREHFVATVYMEGDNLPRQASALDRDHAKSDRHASHADRLALTRDPDSDPERS